MTFRSTHISTRWLAAVLAALVTMASIPTGSCENPGIYIMRGMFRGIFNVIAAPAEVPRLVVYETAENWIYGPFLGLGEGVYCTVFRELLAAWDIVTFGLLPEGTSPYRFYKMKDYFWEEHWLPPEPLSDRIGIEGARDSAAEEEI